MKAVLVVVLFCLVTIHASFVEDLVNSHPALRDIQQEAKKRQSQSECAIVTCVDKGAACFKGDECTGCTPQITACFQSVNFTSTDPTPQQQYCSCYQQADVCLKTLPSVCSASGGLFKSCNDSLGTACACPADSTAQPSYSICKFNYYCNNSTRTCSDKLAVGSACIDDGDCGNSIDPFFTNQEYSCAGTPSTCSLDDGWAYPGDVCTASKDCAGAAVCTGGICVGVAIGGTCTTSDECVYGSYCNTKTAKCEAQLAAGAACDPTQKEICAGDSTCLNGVGCIPKHSRTAGQSCNESAANQDQCNFGLACLTTGCATPITPPPCTTSDDCTGVSLGSNCGCSLAGTKVCNVPEAFPPLCADVYKLIIDCTQLNQCKTVSSAPGSCSMTKCPAEVGCALKCVTENPSFFGSDTTTCVTFPQFTCTIDGVTGNSSSGSMVIVSLALVAFLLSLLM